MEVLDLVEDGFVAHAEDLGRFISVQPVSEKTLVISFRSAVVSRIKVMARLNILPPGGRGRSRGLPLSL